MVRLGKRLGLTDEGVIVPDRYAADFDIVPGFHLRVTPDGTVDGPPLSGYPSMPLALHQYAHILPFLTYLTHQSQPPLSEPPPPRALLQRRLLPSDQTSILDRRPNRRTYRDPRSTLSRLPARAIHVPRRLIADVLPN